MHNLRRVFLAEDAARRHGDTIDKGFSRGKGTIEKCTMYLCMCGAGGAEHVDVASAEYPSNYSLE